MKILTSFQCFQTLIKNVQKTPSKKKPGKIKEHIFNFSAVIRIYLFFLYKIHFILIYLYYIYLYYYKIYYIFYKYLFIFKFLSVTAIYVTNSVG